MTRTIGEEAVERQFTSTFDISDRSVLYIPLSILGGKEIGDGCGIDAGNLSPRKRRDGSALVTFIPFGPGISVENPGCGVIQCGFEIIVAEVLHENFNILVRGIVMA